MKANAKHEAAYQTILAELKRLDLTPVEMLAVASNLVGKLIAMQDQRRVTPAMAMDIVTKNIELGNQQALAELLKTGGRA